MVTCGKDEPPTGLPFSALVAGRIESPKPDWHLDLDLNLVLDPNAPCTLLAEAIKELEQNCEQK